MDEWTSVRRSGQAQILRSHTNEGWNIKGRKDETGASLLSRDKANNNTLEKQSHQFFFTKTKLHKSLVLSMLRNECESLMLTVDREGRKQDVENKCYRGMIIQRV